MTSKTFSLVNKDLLRSLTFLQLFAWCLILLIGYFLETFVVALLLVVLSLIQFTSFLFVIRKTNVMIEAEFKNLEDKYLSILTNQKIIFHNRRGGKKSDK